MNGIYRLMGGGCQRPQEADRCRVSRKHRHPVVTTLRLVHTSKFKTAALPGEAHPSITQRNDHLVFWVSRHQLKPANYTSLLSENHVL
ncbi:hypothetical protein I7I51_07775 [Histoplasma capsulatum]|uniref:Uncharacterized protein n=1 Tax=Ajellomyces capsulatus TaxID=5037 RepID=A0A8A1LX42_AJECA|nr:hypothetical protein I7I51_07775 [Histoplasma capsulatum]